MNFFRRNHKNRQTIRDLQQRLATLSEAERGYRAVVENSSDGIARFDRDLNIVYLNRRLRVAWNLDEPARLRLEDLAAAAELHNFLKQSIGIVLKTGQLRVTQQQVCFKGQNIYADWRFIPETDSSGRVATVLVIARDISAIVEAGAALRNSEYRMRQVFESSPVGLVVLDEKIVPLQVNPALCEMLGYSAEDLRGIDYHLISFAEDLPEIEARAARFLADGREPEPFIRRYRRRDGSALWVKVNSTAIPAADDQPALIMAVMQDITQQKLFEDSLTELNATFLAAFDANPAPMSINDLDDGSFRYVNASFERCFGYSRAEVVGRSPFEVPLMTPETLARLSLSIEGQTGVVDVDYEVDVQTRAGQTRHGFVSLAPANIDKRPSLISVFVDLTARRQAEHDLMRLATITDQAEESITVLDTSGTILYVNAAYEQRSGYSRAEVLGYNILAGRDDLCGLLDGIWRQVTSGKAWRGQLCRRRKDGLNYTVEAKLQPVKDHDGRTISYVAVEQDISRELDLERKLVQAQKMEAIGTLAGGIAHDFNNILSPIIGYTEITKAALAADSPLQRNLSQVLKASERAKDMIRHILTFSRQSEQVLEALSLQPLIKESLKLMRATLPSTLAIAVDLDPDCGAVMADATQIHQIVMNLCTNAHHAMPGGGQLSVTLDEVELSADECRPPSSPGRFVRLSVSDTGHGMSAEVMGRIFDPYYTTKGPGKGTGLGLSVVHGVVTRSGGHITVESVLGQGSTFRLYFPRVGAARAVDADLTENGIPRGHERVLLVDDDPMLLDMMRELLEYLGYTVNAQPDGRAALTAFKQNPQAFDLVITDQTMPGLTGAELARELLALVPSLPIILSTGYSDVISEEQARGLGIKAYALKPVVMDELARTIRRILRPTA